MRILRNTATSAAVGGVLLALSGMALSQQMGSQGNSGTGAQNGSMTGQGGGAMGGGQGGGTGNSAGRTPNALSPIAGEDSSLPPETEEAQAKLRNLERQKKLQEDTEKLLSLANELKADVDKSTKDTLSLDVVRKADEIEKLAHSVKEKMKGT